MVYFLLQVAFAVFNAIAFGFGKFFLNTLYWASWVLFHFTCGILGLEDKSTSAFSWLFVGLMFVVYCERSYQDWFFKITRFLSVHNQRYFRRLRNNHHFMCYQNVNEVVLENEINEHREIEPLTRQLEAENRENENEENNLVEADIHRIENDNRRNIARENGADNQRATLENRQNVERERHNTRTSLENRRNCSQEQQRYFLRQRNRNLFHQQERLGIIQHGVEAVILPGLNVYNIFQVDRNLSVLSRHQQALRQQGTDENNLRVRPQTMANFLHRPRLYNSTSHNYPARQLLIHEENERLELPS